MKLKPGLGASYTIRPGNRVGLFYSSRTKQGSWNYATNLATELGKFKQYQVNKCNLQNIFTQLLYYQEKCCSTSLPLVSPLSNHSTVTLRVLRLTLLTTAAWMRPKHNQKHIYAVYSQYSYAFWEHRSHAAKVKKWVQLNFSYIISETVFSVDGLASTSKNKQYSLRSLFYCQGWNIQRALGMS